MYPTTDIKIFLIHQSRLQSAAIQQLLINCDKIKLIGHAYSTEQAFITLRSEACDILWIHLNTPYLSIFSMISQLREHFPDIKIMLTFDYLDMMLIQKLVSIGIAGYLSQDNSEEEIQKAIKSVAAGETYTNCQLTHDLKQRLPDKALKTPKIKNGQHFFSIFDLLSEREFQVTLLLIEGLNIDDVAKRLKANRKTINSYHSRSFEKLGIKTDVDLTLLALRYGLLGQVNHVFVS